MTALKDRTGERYGSLVVEGIGERLPSGRMRWLCKCDCGEPTQVTASNLRSGHTLSCGCMKIESRRTRGSTMVGRRFDMLVVAERFGRINLGSAWLCKCDCGNTIVKKSIDLRSGQAKDCGCIGERVYVAPIGERLAKQIRKGAPDECWPWIGSNNYGYGVIGDGGIQRRVTHLVCERDGRPVPAGMVVLHKCDNPPCCNPAHLVVGTHADNCKDMHAKGRDRYSRAKAIRAIDRERRGVGR